MLKLRFSDGLYPAGRVCGAAAHAVSDCREGADALNGRERVRRLGATHPTHALRTTPVFRRPPSRKEAV
ncbi:hypothetical protein [Neisseria bacilliformis]|uniref:hypothetical protein n=1 Tax=Neisseria bacilliformis TaxID=267212 RepID=UPI0028EB2BA0|nr:hypothetical protein [Neisseria bacilliformis]